MIRSRVGDHHADSLEWFAEHAGAIVPFSAFDIAGRKLHISAQGIYKPATSEYALSLRQSLAGIYEDFDPIPTGFDRWLYRYHQQGNSIADLHKLSANKGLLHCIRDRIPVGVIRQVKAKPSPLYAILGLALVRSVNGRHFILEGLQPIAAEYLAQPEVSLSVMPSFDHFIVKEFAIEEMLADNRLVEMRAVAIHQGQREFRKELLELYQNRCVITSYDAPEALDAAHILPYKGKQTNTPKNGLILRADIHNLFDLGLLGINDSHYEVVLSERLESTSYSHLKGTTIILPDDESLRPDPALLNMHLRQHSLI